jgi:hypothetical protein
MTSSALTTIESTALISMGDYAVPSQQTQQRYPALQVSNYRPSADSKPVWVFSDGSAAIFSESARDLLKLQPIVCHYDEPVEMFQPTAQMQFAVMAYPKVFTQHKESKKVDFLRKGVMFKENNLVSIAKLLLCPIVDGTPLEDDNGVPQIVTLKLSSTRAGLVKSQRADDLTLDRINREYLKSAGRSSGWLLQLAAIGITPIVRKISSSSDPKLSSMAIDFALDIGIPLDSSHWAGMAALAQSQELLDYNANPFNIESVGSNSELVSEYIDF